MMKEKRKEENGRRERATIMRENNQTKIEGKKKRE